MSHCCRTSGDVSRTFDGPPDEALRVTGTMRLRTYSVLRAAGFLALYFFALPSALVLLNERLGWPRWENPVFDAAGTVLVVSGVGLCLHCAWLFRTLGRGTPVPVQPPDRLVVSGPFRFARHPMYVGYVAIGAGVYLIEGHLALLLYPVALFLLAQLYLVKLEEPRLAERFGEEYEEYCRRVPRWLPPRSAARPAGHPKAGRLGW